MDLWQTLRILIRRWYVVLPLAILSVVAAQNVRAGVQPGYTVSAVGIVLPPDQARVNTPDGVEIRPVNPLLNLSGSTPVAAQALAVVARSRSFKSRIGVSGQLAAYTVSVLPREPIMNVSVESKDPDFALAAAQDVLRGLEEELDRQQGQPEPEQRLGFTVLSSPSITAVDKSPLRAFLVTLVVGLLATAALAIVVEALSTLQRGRRTPGAELAVRAAQRSEVTPTAGTPSSRVP